MPQDVGKTHLHPSFLTGRNQIRRGTQPGRARGAGLAEVEHSPAGNAEKETIWSVEVLWINMRIPPFFFFLRVKGIKTEMHNIFLPSCFSTGLFSVKSPF